jgi:hypothetical protein
MPSKFQPALFTQIAIYKNKDILKLFDYYIYLQ